MGEVPPLVDLVRAPEGATSKQLRVLGLKGAGLGLVLFLPGVLLFIVARDWMIATLGVHEGDTVRIPRVVGALVGGPMTVGYVLMMIGLERVVFGAAAHSKSVIVGILRLLFGVVMTIGLVVVGGLIFAVLAG